MPFTSIEAFKCPSKYSKCAWHPCKLFCFMSTFLPFPASLFSCFQDQSTPEANSHINLKCRQTCPALKLFLVDAEAKQPQKPSVKKTLVRTTPVVGFWEWFSGLPSKSGTWQTISSGHGYSSSRVAHSGSIQRELLTPASAGSVFRIKWEQKSTGLWQTVSSLTASMNPSKSREKNSRMDSSTSASVNGVCRECKARSKSVSDTECSVSPLLRHLCAFAAREMNTILLNTMWFLVLALNWSLKQKHKPKCSSILRIRLSLCLISCSFFNFCH